MASTWAPNDWITGELIDHTKLNNIGNSIRTWGYGLTPGTVTINANQNNLASVGQLSFAAGGGISGNANMTGILTFTGSGRLHATTGGHRIGGLLGASYTTNLTQADASMLFYVAGTDNWAGLGGDGSGNIWIRTGLTGPRRPTVTFGSDGTTYFYRASSCEVRCMSGNSADGGYVVQDAARIYKMGINVGGSGSGKWTLFNISSATPLIVADDTQVQVRIGGALRTLTVDGLGYVKVA